MYTREGGGSVSKAKKFMTKTEALEKMKAKSRQYVLDSDAMDFTYMNLVRDDLAPEHQRLRLHQGKQRHH